VDLLPERESLADQTIEPLFSSGLSRRRRNRRSTFLSYLRRQRTGVDLTVAAPVNDQTLGDVLELPDIAGQS
jgi:hypothetical protein